MELRIHYATASDRFNPALSKPQPNWTGLFRLDEEKPIIWVEAASSNDPESLVATFAHELAHAHLLGQKRVSPEEEDLEQLTDLTTVYFGMGIFPANCAFRDKSYHAANWQGWSISRQGYLDPPTWSYALAVYAWRRQERKPPWTGYLRPTVRAPCRQAIAYLWRAGISTPEESVDGVKPPTPFLFPVPNPQMEADAPAVERELAPDGQSAHVVVDAEGELVLHAILDLENGRWEAAIRAFSTAIENDPEDGELYHYRSLALLELGQSREALADAECAVRLQPEEAENYLTRGMACCQAKAFRRAVSDLTRYLGEEDVHACDGKRPSKAYYFRGLAYAAQGDLRHALSDYTKAIYRWPNWPQPYTARAEVYERLAQAEKAVADREEAARRGGNGPAR
jgi:tetratricopeptide (TPR) repeat protein